MSAGVGQIDLRTGEITHTYQLFQVMVRVFGGSFEGEGGTPLPLESPLDNPYYMWGSYGPPLGDAVRGVFSHVR